jgi:hypothetical protein
MRCNSGRLSSRARPHRRIRAYMPAPLFAIAFCLGGQSGIEMSFSACRVVETRINRDTLSHFSCSSLSLAGRLLRLLSTWRTLQSRPGIGASSGISTSIVKFLKPHYILAGFGGPIRTLGARGSWEARRGFTRALRSLTIGAVVALLGVSEVRGGRFHLQGWETEIFSLLLWCCARFVRGPNVHRHQRRAASRCVPSRNTVPNTVHHTAPTQPLHRG